MPLEPLPLGRKDIHIHNDKKGESSDSVHVESVVRWREPLYQGSPEFVRGGSGDSGRLPGHGNQEPWQQFAEESAHVFTPSGSADRILDHESYQTNLHPGERRPTGTSEESNGPLGLESSFGKHLEINAVSSCVSSRNLDMNVQRSVNVVLTYSSHPHSDIVNSRDQLHFKNPPDKTGTINGLNIHQRSEASDAVNFFRSIDRRPHKWNRSGNLSSCGPGFSHSSSPTSMAAEILETKIDSQLRNVATVQSPSRDATPRATSTSLSEETSSRKKQRLGWGEGLAKYEKKKVGSPDGSQSKKSNSIHSIRMNLAQRSPKVTGFSDCSSPATPSSVACSSSPGVGEKTFLNTISVATDPSHLSGSPGFVLQEHIEEHLINLEKLELKSISNLSYSIVELLQSDDMSMMGSNVSRSAAINKLLTWKDDILKAVEITDSEIDQFENELKLLSSKSECDCTHKAASTCPRSTDNAKPNGRQIATADLKCRSSQLRFFSENVRVDIENNDGYAPKDVNGVTKDEDSDSPGTATSKFVDPLKVSNVASPSYIVNHDACFGNLESSRLRTVPVDHSKRSNGEGFGCEDFKKNTDCETANPFSLVVSSYAVETDFLYDILSTNKDLANESAKMFSKFLPKKNCFVDVTEASRNDCGQNELLLTQKFLVKKQFLRFKERIASLKFRILLHMWKEDLHLLSSRKYHSKSQKKIELSSRTLHAGFQRSRSSVRSQSISPWNRPGLSKELNNFVGKLLVDNQVKQCRESLKMPALIMDDREKRSRFISGNGLVEDPCAAEYERARINPWTPEEKATFIDKLGVLGKDFKRIATFLDHKTIADCVEFYYKNHKSDRFSKVKKHRKPPKSFPACTYLLTSGKNRNSSAASLDMLGEASVLAARNGASCSDEKSTSLDGTGDREAAADVLAGIASCNTASAYGDDVDGVDDDDSCSDQSCGEADRADWRDDERSVFLECLASHGRDFEAISRRLGTRSREDCKVFFSKGRKCLGLDRICRVRENRDDRDASASSGTEPMDVEDSPLVMEKNTSFEGSDSPIDRMICDVSGQRSCTHDSLPAISSVSELQKVKDSLSKAKKAFGNSGGFLRRCRSESDEENPRDVKLFGQILSPANPGGGPENETTGNPPANGVRVRSSGNGSAEGLKMRYEEAMKEKVWGDGGG